ncbi:hypothetical protein TorRG33x02_210180 [Trema orientale]|uniref:Uncharacterized protein n=1 Tax=Trema orientale TaxID=63057 RepID=A0A2P5ECD8_TREOI|nr:hypothetical protein TorRG33x02_210180 [Trema orientale]
MQLSLNTGVCVDLISIKVEQLTNNITASFNNWVDELRFMPLIALLDGIRIRHTDQMYTKKITADRWNGKLTSNVQNRINILLKKARGARVIQCGKYEFQVDSSTETCVVKLDEGTCICG